MPPEDMINVGKVTDADSHRQSQERLGGSVLI